VRGGAFDRKVAGLARYETGPAHWLPGRLRADVKRTGRSAGIERACR